VLNREFTAERPNAKWLADITYLDTYEGWLYLAAVLDVYSRRIVGWSMHTRLTTDLVEDALRMALGQRPHADDLLHHSDRGSQYTSGNYQTLLAQAQITPSMSGTGNCYDNAMMESFFATLKTECADHRFATRAEARRAIFEFIEVWLTVNGDIQPSTISHRQRMRLCHARQLVYPPNSGKFRLRLVNPPAGYRTGRYSERGYVRPCAPIGDWRGSPGQSTVLQQLMKR
jgi:hypothetical protein